MRHGLTFAHVNCRFLHSLRTLCRDKEPTNTCISNYVLWVSPNTPYETAPHKASRIGTELPLFEGCISSCKVYSRKPMRESVNTFEGGGNVDGRGSAAPASSASSPLDGPAPKPSPIRGEYWASGSMSFSIKWRTAFEFSPNESGLMKSR